ncbi:MAG TPA: WS/DGAT domain-containing protein [Longimicrobium sp.]|nr:WS/DGAT domain-containing protein [Longimicrobium sp.]
MSTTDPRLGAADAAWWRMDEASNPMVITAVLTFGAPVSHQTLERRVRERLLPLLPFRSRLREPALGIGRPRWAPDPEFSLNRHLIRATLPAPAGEAELQALVSRLMGERLDPRHPLWRFHLIAGYQGGAALVARIHHCIADGMALIQLLLTLDDVPGNEGAGALACGNGTAAAVARRPAGARAAAWAASAFGRLVLEWPDPRTALSGPLGMEKVAAWCEPFPLSELRGVARATGSKVNDVLAAAVSGALARYLAAGGRGVPGRGLRAVVPVNLRPADDASLLGNRFGLVFLSLPVGVADPARRLAGIRAEMRRLKGSAEAGVTYALLRLFGPAGRALVRFAVWFLGMKASLVFTDVPGPREAVTVCGAPLTRLMAWVPQSGRLSVGVSAVSYAGQVQVGIAADRGLVPNPAELVAAFRAAMDELVAAAPAALQEA